jgi:hypothetical protein
LKREPGHYSADAGVRRKPFAGGRNIFVAPVPAREAKPAAGACGFHRGGQPFPPGNFSVDTAAASD